MRLHLQIFFFMLVIVDRNEITKTGEFAIWGRNSIFGNVFNALHDSLLLGSLVNHEVALNLSRADELVELQDVVGELRGEQVHAGTVVEPPVHHLQLIPRAVTDELFEINPAGSDERRVQSGQVICGHEHDPRLRRRHTIESVQ